MKSMMNQLLAESFEMQKHYCRAYSPPRNLVEGGTRWTKISRPEPAENKFTARKNDEEEVLPHPPTERMEAEKFQLGFLV
jgi:hypothetical protein